MNGTQLLTWNYIYIIYVYWKIKIWKDKTCKHIVWSFKALQIRGNVRNMTEQNTRTEVASYLVSVNTPWSLICLLSPLCRWCFTEHHSTGWVSLSSRLSVCVWEWLSCWFVCDSLQGKWPSGVFKTWLSPFYVQLLWYMMQDIILSWWHLFLRMCASVGLSPSAHNNSGTQDEPLKLLAHRVQVTAMWLFEHLTITLNNSLISMTGYVLYIMMIMVDH